MNPRIESNISKDQLTHALKSCDFEFNKTNRYLNIKKTELYSLLKQYYGCIRKTAVIYAIYRRKD